MSYLGNEETLVELPAVEYLEKNLGYSFAHGKDLTPDSGARDSLADVVLASRLRASLKKLNSWMREDNFRATFFTGILNRYNAYVGTISSKYNHYSQWK